MNAPHPLDGKLEPELKDSMDERAPLYSMAISLKRIADILEGQFTESKVIYNLYDLIKNVVSR